MEIFFIFCSLTLIYAKMEQYNIIDGDVTINVTSGSSDDSPKGTQMVVSLDNLVFAYVSSDQCSVIQIQNITKKQTDQSYEQSYEWKLFCSQTQNYDEYDQAQQTGKITQLLVNDLSQNNNLVITDLVKNSQYKNHFCSIEQIIFSPFPGKSNCCCQTIPINLRNSDLSTSAIVAIAVSLSGLFLFTIVGYIIYQKHSREKLDEKYQTVQANI